MKSKTLFLLLILFLSLTFSQAFSFSIRTNPPLSLNGFTCECSISACECSQGSLKFSVNLDTPKKASWEKFASKSFFGDSICAEPCINYIGEITYVELPFWKLETLESAEKTASLSVKKTMNFSQKADYLLKILKDFFGISQSADSEFSLLKEKMLSTTKKLADEQRVDLTTYFFYDFLTNVLQFSQEDLRLSDFFILTNFLSDLAKQGKLKDFLNYYFLAKAYPELPVLIDPFSFVSIPPEEVKIFINERVKILKALSELENKNFKEALEKLKPVLESAKFKDFHKLRVASDLVYHVLFPDLKNPLLASARGLYTLKYGSGYDYFINPDKLLKDISGNLKIKFDKAQIKSLLSTLEKEPQKIEKISKVLENAKKEQQTMEVNKSEKSFSFAKFFVVLALMAVAAFLIVKKIKLKK